MSVLSTIRIFFLSGLLISATLLVHGQDTGHNRLPMVLQSSSRTSMGSQAIEADVLNGLRVHAPRNQLLAGIDAGKQKAEGTDAGTAGNARVDLIEVDLQAFARKPLGTAPKP